MKNKINYQHNMEVLLSELENRNPPPTLLLHSCCAPCSSYVIEYLSQYFKITVFYYNPNISPEDEYLFRKKEQIRLISEMPTKYKVDFLDCDYNADEFFLRCKGHELDNEGGDRCSICFEMRLSEAAKAAERLQFDYFATTLTVSPLKNAENINTIGINIAQKYNTQYLPSDFKKKNGYKRTIELSKKYNLYRQNYCGCIFSKREMLLREQKKTEVTL